LMHLEELFLKKVIRHVVPSQAYNDASSFAQENTFFYFFRKT
jgi:hypothetical protein